ncbi:trypsin-like peptidase domain-containing protein [Neobacillus cucumis]|uniref:S1C family serine protease n=1 Tax=Neobacillus cucumis TaxID=1740721 RepID=UPI0018DF4EEF|nr:trypsin-like peptidase domain-containing protein [Neobacillus cucumis]MBI0575772.1 trypsin-like peptidase domain-containing protein [Neobacillus cucumis]
MNYKDDFNPENEQNETNSIDLTMPASSRNESDVKKPNVDHETNTHDFDRSSYETHNTQETNYREYTTASHGGEATRSKEEPKTSNKRNLKGFASTLAAGVIGSVLTLTILPHTDYMKNYFEKADNQSAATEVKPVTAQPTVAKTSGASIADTVEKVSKAIVGIENYQKQQSSDFFGNSSPSQSVETGSGSGVIFQKNNNDAYIVTNNHVVEGASKLEISLYNGEKTKAEVVGTDALTDLAVLKIDAKYVNATASFGDSSTLRPGDQVYAIGNPLGLDLSRTVTQGIISATNRSIAVDTSAGSWDTNVIQTDAAINPGNSGGALINSQGQVIGINSLKISENGVEGLGFAIPSNDAIPIVNQLIKNGKIERPYIGIGLEDLDQIPQIYWQNLPSSVQKGVMITQVDPHSAASSSGLEVKDVIVSMNGTKIGSSSELRKYLYTKVNVGDTVKFGVYRNGKLKTIDVKLSK